MKSEVPITSEATVICLLTLLTKTSNYRGNRPVVIYKKGVLNRNSHRRCSVKKDVLKNFEKFTGKHLRQSLILVTLQA